MREIHASQACIPLSLRARVAGWPHDGALEWLTPGRLAAVAAEEGVDFATALLFDRLVGSPEHGPFIDEVNELRAAPPRGELGEVTFAVAPGAFYREMPHIHADGALLRAMAARCGCRTELIPVPSTAGLEENARILVDWLLAQPARPILLASLSKGGADVRLALRSPAAGRAFRHVAGWLNVCGMVNGTPLVPALLASPWRRWLVRRLFRWQGLDFQMVRDLDPSPGGLLAGPLRLPPHVRLVSVVGFPLQHQMTTRRARLWRRFLDPLGPNDGGVLLADVCSLPGVVYPVWGVDHYLSPERIGLDSLAPALLAWLGRRLEPPRREAAPR